MRKQLFILLGVLFLGACTRSSERVFTGRAFGSEYEIRVLGKDSKVSSEQLEKAIGRVVGQCEAALNAADPNSEISKFNQSEKLTWLPASRPLVVAVEEALRAGKLSDGAYDPTAGKLIALYKGIKEPGREPGPQALASAMGKVAYHAVEARQDPLALKKSRRGLIVDLGSLAQAYTVDAVADELLRLGVTGFQVKAGEAIRASGKNKNNEAWPYAFQRVAQSERVPVHLTTEVIPLQNRAAATKMMHVPGQSTLLLDPRTGKPLSTDLLNVTVLDASALRAQALAEVFFVVGKAAAIELARKQSAAAYFLSSTDQSAIAEATSTFPSAIRSTQ